MKKSTILIAVLLILVAALFSLFLFYDSPERTSNPESRNSGENTEADDINLPAADSYMNSEAGNAGGGEDSIGAGSIGAGGGGSNSEESGDETAIAPDNACMIVRPGNLPGISCSVNSIEENAVSIKLRNEMGERIEVKMNLDSCGENSGSIENMGEKDFSFSCNNQESYFNQAVRLLYILGEEKVVEINGFIAGKVL